MGFKFKLDSVLAFTLSKEETIRQEYVKLEAQRLRAVEKMDFLRNELFKDNEIEKLDISLLIMQSSYKERIKQQIEQQKEIVEALDKKVETAKAQMIEILQERKTLEKLKEKHRQSFLLDQAKIEQKLLDEQALLAFFRN